MNKQNVNIEANPAELALERLQLANDIFEKLTNILNKIHNTSYPLRFWKIITEPYVNSVISKKQSLAESIQNFAPALEPINSHRHASPKKILVKRMIYFIKALGSRKTLIKIKDALENFSEIGVGFHAPEYLENEIDIHIEDCYPVFIGRGNTQKRNLTNNIAESENTIFYQNIIKQLPKVYIEYFDSIIKSIPLRNPDKKTFHVSTMKSFFMNILVAKYVVEGSKLLFYQHGAFYGELIGHLAYNFENSVSDIYKTWGWKIADNDEPWKAYRLKKFRENYFKYQKSEKFDLLFALGLLSDETKDDVKNLLNKLDKNKFPKIMARPRPGNKVFSHASQLKFIKNDNRVTISSGLNSIAEDISKSKIIIQLTVPSTNFLECFFIDHPTVGILKNRRPTHIVKPFYDFLLEKKVLHHSCDSLVEHLNTVDLNSWWSDLLREPMYQSFKNTFLRDS